MDTINCYNRHRSQRPRMSTQNSNIADKLPLVRFASSPLNVRNPDSVEFYGWDYSAPPTLEQRTEKPKFTFDNSCETDKLKVLLNNMLVLKEFGVSTCEAKTKTGFDAIEEIVANITSEIEKAKMIIRGSGEITSVRNIEENITTTKRKCNKKSKSVGRKRKR